MATATFSGPTYDDAMTTVFCQCPNPYPTENDCYYCNELPVPNVRTIDRRTLQHERRKRRPTPPPEPRPRRDLTVLTPTDFSSDTEIVNMDILDSVQHPPKSAPPVTQERLYSYFFGCIKVYGLDGNNIPLSERNVNFCGRQVPCNTLECCICTGVVILASAVFAGSLFCFHHFFANL